MIRWLLRFLSRCWHSLNYRYCMSNAYLATQQHKILEAVGWSQLASDWQDEWRKV